MPHYQFVDEPDTLVPELQRQGQIGIDTEFMREPSPVITLFTIVIRLCLIFTLRILEKSEIEK